jgi:hypothetical protein
VRDFGKRFVHGPVMTLERCMGIDVDRCPDLRDNILYCYFLGIQIIVFVVKMMHHILRLWVPDGWIKRFFVPYGQKKVKNCAV